MKSILEAPKEILRSKNIENIRNETKHIRTSHAWKKLSNGTNFAEPVVASFFGIEANIACLKALCIKEN